MKIVPSTSPAFNLKVVVSETGIKPDTLRAWERRYGLPQPQRTEGKHRLYSEYDLETIKWLAARQADGLSISRAVQLWRRLEEEGQNPLQVYAEDALEGAAVTAVSGGRIEDMREAWIDACREFNEIAAEQVLSQAFAIYAPETVCVQVIMQGLATIGSQWYTGEVTVQQEHFTSSLAMRRLHTLVAAAPPPTRRERIIVGCPPGEVHVFAPLLITLLLRYRGWDVIYLGADVPIERFEAILEAVRPDLVLLSVQQLHTAASLLKTAGFMEQQQVPLAFGGLIFNLIPDLQTRIPGHFLGTRLGDTPQVVENLVNFRPPVPDVSLVDESYRIAMSYFREHQSQIEAHMWRQFQQAEIPYVHFVNANMHMARNIISALALGSMDYIGVELAWIRQLLVNYQWPDGMLMRYLMAYHEAADLYLNDRGRPVVNWLAQVIENEKVNGDK